MVTNLLVSLSARDGSSYMACAIQKRRLYEATDQIIIFQADEFILLVWVGKSVHFMRGLFLIYYVLRNHNPREFARKTAWHRALIDIGETFPSRKL